MGNPGQEAGLRLTRRATLALLVGAGVAACSPGDNADPEPSPTPDPDALTREDVAAQEWALVSLYDAAIAAEPGQAKALATLRDQHVEHASALGSTTPGASAPASAAPGRAQLAAAEEEASRARVTSCSRAVDAELARLLALIGASEAGHAAYLRTASA